TRTQRIIGFSICLGMGVTCFILASLFIPVLLLKARKFAILFTLGSVFILCSFSFLSGPWNHFKHLFSKERVLFTVCYLGTLISTLYVSLSLQSTALTVVFGLLQITALIWYVISYLPGGQTGLMFFSKIVTKAASRTLPV
ncbi:protein transport protein SFT2-like protein, partial [Leptotrombidium deliense]